MQNLLIPSRLLRLILRGSFRDHDQFTIWNPTKSVIGRKLPVISWISTQNKTNPLEEKTTPVISSTSPPPQKKKPLVNWQIPSAASLWGSGQRGPQGSEDQWRSVRVNPFFRRKPGVPWSTYELQHMIYSVLFPLLPQCTIMYCMYVCVWAWVKP